jgi:hypothetical protein
MALHWPTIVGRVITKRRRHSQQAVGDLLHLPGNAETEGLEMPQGGKLRGNLRQSAPTEIELFGFVPSGSGNAATGSSKAPWLCPWCLLRSLRYPVLSPTLGRSRSRRKWVIISPSGTDLGTVNATLFSDVPGYCPTRGKVPKRDAHGAALLRAFARVRWSYRARSTPDHQRNRWR